MPNQLLGSDLGYRRRRGSRTTPRPAGWDPLNGADRLNTFVVQNLRHICRATALPVVADADTGYGNIINVRRTVREYEGAGVAGLHIEDQVFPKKCGFMEGKEVIAGPPSTPLQALPFLLSTVAASCRASLTRTHLIGARCRVHAADGEDSHRPGHAALRRG